MYEHPFLLYLLPVLPVFHPYSLGTEGTCSAVTSIGPTVLGTGGTVFASLALGTLAHIWLAEGKRLVPARTAIRCTGVFPCSVNTVVGWSFHVVLQPNKLPDS